MVDPLNMFCQHLGVITLTTYLYILCTILEQVDLIWDIKIESLHRANLVGFWNSSFFKLY